MEQVDDPEEGGSPVRGSCCSWFGDRICDPVGDLCCHSLFLKDCTPLEGLVLNKFVEDCVLWDGPYTGAGMEGEEKGVMNKLR